MTRTNYTCETAQQILHATPATLAHGYLSHSAIPSVMEKLTLLRKLIDTTTSPVFLCQSTDSLELVAVKRFNVKSKQHQIEVQTMQRLANGGHENLFKLYDVLQGSRTVNIVMEYCPKGDLCTHLKTRKWLRHSEALSMFHQIVSGVLHLHKSGLAHRNLSLDNILIDKEGVCKVCDFGSATTQSVASCKSKRIGLKRYRSPEIAAGKGTYSPYRADIWSLGVILFCLLCGKFAFRKAKTTDKAFVYFCNHGLHRLISLYHLDKYFTTEIVDLLERMLSVHPESRINLTQVLVHPLFE